MKTDKVLSTQWIVVGSISGITANMLFPILLMVSLPSYLELFLASIFGILFSLTGFGWHHLLQRERKTIATQIGALFIFCGGVVFNLMLMVQLTFKGYLEYFQENTTQVPDLYLLDWIRKTVDPVHLGMQLSNDFFTGIAMILFAGVMYNSRCFGKIWGITGFLIGVSLLVTKCYAFPRTPYELGIPYVFGPLIVCWFIAVCIQSYRNRNFMIDA